MSAEMFKMLTGVNIVHIPYKGSGPALADLMGGQVDVMFDNLTSSIGLIRSGKLRALAVTTSARYPGLPDVPTVQETVPGYEATAWFGIVAPGGTPREVVMRINGEVNKALAQADVKEKLAQQGALARSWTPEEFGAFIHNEVVKWGQGSESFGRKGGIANGAAGSSGLVETLSFARQLRQQRRGFPEIRIPVGIGGEALHAVDDLVQSHLVGIEHRPAPVPGKTVTGQVDHVDVGSAR